MQALESLQAGHGVLLDAHGSRLNTHHTLEAAGVNFGDVLTLHQKMVAVAGSVGAVAALLGGESVVSWGDPANGSSSSVVQEQLRNVQQIQATTHAFAAILHDRWIVVTWGSPGGGGDNSGVQEQLRKVQQIQATQHAFAAILQMDRW